MIEVIALLSILFLIFISLVLVVYLTRFAMYLLVIAINIVLTLASIIHEQLYSRIYKTKPVKKFPHSLDKFKNEKKVENCIAESLQCSDYGNENEIDWCTHYLLEKKKLEKQKSDSSLLYLGAGLLLGFLFFG